MNARPNRRRHSQRHWLATVRLHSDTTVAELGERMGCTTQNASIFQRWGSDPKLSTVRKFIQACNARATIVVTYEDGSQTWHEL